VPRLLKGASTARGGTTPVRPHLPLEWCPTHWHDERPVAGHHVGALICKIPLQSEIAFASRRRVCGNDRNEEFAVANLPPNLLVPDVPAPQLALVEPHFDIG
jgi:hypothetical protein